VSNQPSVNTQCGCHHTVNVRSKSIAVSKPDDRFYQCEMMTGTLVAPDSGVAAHMLATGPPRHGQLHLYTC
jgi:hypothetical protein